MSEADVAMLAAIARGDEAALESLYEALHARLYRFLIGITRGDSGRAEDALAETFFDVWRHASRFRGASSVRTWVFGIARHKALSQLRHRGATADPDDALARLPADE